MKTLNIVEDVLIASGITISLMDLQQVLSIILLSVQVCLIIAKIIIKVVNHIKNKNIEEAVKSIEDGQKEIESITPKDK